MITTAVQQASQIVEIQGAPVTVLASGDDFRVTLAESVSNATAQKSGQKAAAGEGNAGNQAVSDLAKLASAKSFQAGLTARNASGAASGKAPAAAGGLEAAENDVFSEATAASLQAVKAGGDLALNEDEAVRVAGDAPAAKNDLRWAVVTRTTDESQGVSAADAKGLVVDKGIASATTSNDVGPKILDGAGGTRGLKAGMAGAGKQLNTVKAAVVTATAPGAEAVSFVVPETIQPALETSAIAQTQQTSASDSHSLAQKGAIAAVVTTVLEATDGAAPATGGTFHPLNTGAEVSGTEAAATSQASGLLPSGSSESGAKAGTGKLPETGEEWAASGHARPHGNGRVLESAETQNTLGSESTSGANRIGTANRTSQDAGGPAISQARLLSATPSGAFVQTLGTLHSATAIARTGQKPLRNAGTKDVEQLTDTTTASVITASGGAAIAQANLAVPEADGVARNVVPVSSPPREASSKPELGAAKDGKTKIAAAAAEETVAGGTAIGQPLGADASVVNAFVASSTAPAASVNGAAGRVVTAVEAAAPAIVATPQAAGMSVHGAANNGSPAAAHTLSAVSAGSLVDSTAAAGQGIESHRTLVATPTTLEVGVQSGTQGWLRIRAEIGDQGAVNASLSASSTGGRELLHSQAPALNAFLHSEQMVVTTTVVDRGAAADGTHGGGTMGSGGLSGQDGSGNPNDSLLHGGGAQGNGAQRESSQPTRAASESDGARGFGAPSAREAEGVTAGRASSAGESGRWLNVRV